MNNIPKIYLHDLRFKTPEEFEKWCINHNYPNIWPFPKKTWKTIKKRRIAQIADEKLAERKYNPLLQQIDWYHVDEKIKKDFEDLFIYLNNVRTKFIKDKDYVSGLKIIIQLRDEWVRDPKTWKPNSHNMHKQFSSFLAHVFCKYPAPVFLEKAFYQGCNNRIDYCHWFIELGSGVSVKKIVSSFTKKQAYFWLNTPEKYTIPNSFFYALVMARGGTEKLFETLVQTRIYYFFDNEFKTSVVDFFVRHTMFDYDQISSIIDYIAFRKEESEHFTLKGRSALSLLEKSSTWHQHIRHEKRKTLGCNHWEPTRYKQHTESRGKAPNNITYSIRELLTVKDLIKEGRALRHCVASYAHSCRKRMCSIWSFHKVSGCEETKLITIEVHKDGQIGQMQGRAQRAIHRWELEIIRNWVNANDLKSVRKLD